MRNLAKDANTKWKENHNKTWVHFITYKNIMAFFSSFLFVQKVQKNTKSRIKCYINLKHKFFKSLSEGF